MSKCNWVSTFNIIVLACHNYTRTVCAKIHTTTIYVPYSSSWISTKRTIGPIVRVAFDCGSLPINERSLCASCLQAVHSISSHQHDRFAIFFFYTHTFIIFLVPITIIVWMFFFAYLILASVTIIACSADFSRPNTIYDNCLEVRRNKQLT